MKLNEICESHGDRENRDLDKAPPAGNLSDLCTTSQAAKILGVTASRVRQMIMDKELTAVQSPVKGQRDNMLKTSEVRAHKGKMKDAGRPPKEEEKNKENKRDQEVD